MTAELVLWGRFLGHPTGILVSPADAAALYRDAAIYGNVYVRPTGERRADGVPVCDRIPPRDLMPA